MNENYYITEKEKKKSIPSPFSWQYYFVLQLESKVFSTKSMNNSNLKKIFHTTLDFTDSKQKIKDEIPKSVIVLWSDAPMAKFMSRQDPMN